MKKQFKLVSLLFAFAALVCNSAFAQTAVQKTTAPQANQQNATAKRRSLMWKVTGKNNTAYLLGSVHLATKNFYPMPAEIETAFAQSNVLAVEINVNKVNPAAFAPLIQERGMYAGDDTIWKNISAATSEKLRKFAADYSIPAAIFDKQKPWLAALTVTLVPLQKNGFDPNLGVDKYFLDKAAEQKRIAEIESADWQLQLLSGQSPAEQEKFLASSLAQAADIKKFAALLEGAWLNGDAEQIVSATDQMNSDSPEFSKKLLDDRNPKMADFAENCVKGTDKCFVVVGAAHLTGKKGVVQILKDRGYTVEQISVAAAK